jgi:Ion channel
MMMRHAEKIRSQTDLLLLLSVLLVIVIYPLLDHDGLRRLILAALIFVPVLLATIRLSKKRGWVWPSVLLMSASFIVAAASTVFPIPTLVGMKWGLLTVFFGFTVFGLFSYLKDARSVTNAHLYTAISIYLLLGMQWFTLYSAINVFYPGSILHNNATIADRQSELLYFSLVTLSTIGYGDVVPLRGEVRILAALEGIAGVLYIAITVALLVSAYKQQDTLQEP